MNQAHDLTRSPHLCWSANISNRWNRETYTKIHITVQEYLTSTLATDKRGDVAEFAALALLLGLQCFPRHLVAEQPAGVPPAAQHQRGISLLGVHNRLLDFLVNWRFDSTHESRSHINTLRTQRQRRRQPLPISKPTGRDKRNLKLLPRTTKQDEIRDITLTHVTRAFKPVNGQEINAQFHSGLGVSDSRALVQDGCVCFLELLDDRAWVVACCFDDLDALVDDDLCVGGVVWRDESGEEGYVYAEGVLRHGAASADFFAEVFGGGLGEGC